MAASREGREAVVVAPDVQQVRVLRLWGGILLASFVAAAGRADVVFSGFMNLGGHPLFVVSVDGEQSGWLAERQTFRGVRIVSFEAKSEVLTVEREGRCEQVRLAGAKVRNGYEAVLPPPLPPPPIVVSLAGQEDIVVADDLGALPVLKAKVTLWAQKGQLPKEAVIRATKSADPQRVAKVMELLRQAGITKFSVAAEP